MPIKLVIHPLRDGTHGGQFMQVTLPDGTVIGNANREPVNDAPGGAQTQLRPVEQKPISQSARACTVQAISAELSGRPLKGSSASAAARSAKAGFNAQTVGRPLLGRLALEELVDELHRWRTIYNVYATSSFTYVARPEPAAIFAYITSD